LGAQQEVGIFDLLSEYQITPPLKKIPLDGSSLAIQDFSFPFTSFPDFLRMLSLGKAYSKGILEIM
jgi:hypothetical protein